LIGFRDDESPIPHQFRSLVWISRSSDDDVPDIDSAIARAKGVPSYPVNALRALADLQTNHDDDARRLRVHMRQHWTHSVDLLNARAFGDVLELWKPFLDITTFRADHPRWSDEPAVRVTIHGIKSILFQTCVRLGDRAPDEYTPLAFSILRELIATPPFVA